MHVTLLRTETGYCSEMDFPELKELHPDLLCTCGHPAGIHLNCGEHLCSRLGCHCEGFEEDDSLENVLIVVRGAASEPVDSN